jgi:hypothetical protein
MYNFDGLATVLKILFGLAIVGVMGLIGGFGWLCFFLVSHLQWH